jgi:hypothetical protein
MAKKYNCEWARFALVMLSVGKKAGFAKPQLLPAAFYA